MMLTLLLRVPVRVPTPTGSWVVLPPFHRTLRVVGPIIRATRVAWRHTTYGLDYALCGQNHVHFDR